MPSIESQGLLGLDQVPLPKAQYSVGLHLWVANTCCSCNQWWVAALLAPVWRRWDCTFGAGNSLCVCGFEGGMYGYFGLGCTFLLQ